MGTATATTAASRTATPTFTTLTSTPTTTATPTSTASPTLTYTPTSTSAPTVTSTPSRTPLPTPVDDGEPNETCLDAHSISVNTDYFFLPDDTLDIYKVDLAEASPLSVELIDFTPLDGQLAVWMGECGNLVLIGRASDSALDRVLDLGTRPTGSYVIQIVIDGQKSEARPYRLRASTEPPPTETPNPDDIAEPNDSICSAYQIAANEDYFFQANDKNDWYVFALTETDHLVVTLTDYYTNGQLVAFGGSCASPTLIQNNGNDGSTKTLDLGERSPGQYFIWVLTEGPFTEIPYGFYVSTAEVDP